MEGKTIRASILDKGSIYLPDQLLSGSRSAIVPHNCLEIVVWDSRQELVFPCLAENRPSSSRLSRHSRKGGGGSSPAMIRCTRSAFDVPFTFPRKHLQ